MDILGKCCITSLSDLVDILGTVCTPKWNCRAVMRSGSVCLTVLQPVHCIDCFILKKEDAVRFVVINNMGYGGPCGLKWGFPAVRNST